MIPQDLSTWLSVAFLGCSFGFVVWKFLGSPGRKTALAEKAHVVSIDGDIITHQSPDGISESVRFDSLRAVVVETNDLGPFTADVFWILVGEGTSGCYIPQGATGDAQLLELLQTLPGFDNEQFIASMGSTSCQKFLVWQRDAGVTIESFQSSMT
jgi:hypothetical protein